MARIRTHKPEYATSEQIVQCSRDARLLFLLMWNFCDDSGIHTASVMRLKMEVFPADNLTLKEIRAMIDELIAQKLIEEYVVDDEAYWIVTGWQDHQRIDQPHYKYPLPDGKIPSNPVNRRHKNKKVSAITSKISANGQRTQADASTIKNGVSANVRGGIDEVSHAEWNGDKDYSSNLTKPSSDSTQGIGKPQRAKRDLPLPSPPTFVNKRDWDRYLLHRNQRKSPITPEAAKLMFADLQQIHDAGHSVAEAIDRSIMGNWARFYPPDDINQDTGDANAECNYDDNEHDDVPA
jgi:hypothetical protein